MSPLWLSDCNGEHENYLTWSDGQKNIWRLVQTKIFAAIYKVDQSGDSFSGVWLTMISCMICGSVFNFKYFLKPSQTNIVPPVAHCSPSVLLIN